MKQKITNDEIFQAQMLITIIGDAKTIPDEYKEIVKMAGYEVDTIQHLVDRIREEGTLPEEKHRYQAKGHFSDWPSGEEGMPREVLNEFPVEDGMVKISEEEFLDILAYIAHEYYG